MLTFRSLGGGEERGGVKAFMILTYVSATHFPQGPQEPLPKGVFVEALSRV